MSLFHKDAKVLIHQDWKVENISQEVVADMVYGVQELRDEGGVWIRDDINNADYQGPSDLDLLEEVMIESGVLPPKDVQHPESRVIYEGVEWQCLYGNGDR